MRRRRWAVAQEHFGGIVSQPCIAAGPASGEAAASRQTPRFRSAGALLAWLLGFLLIIGLLVGAPVDRAAADTAPVDPLDPSTPVTVSDDALPAPQINGVVWSQAMIGNFVYVGGSFSNARPAGSPAGQNTVARGNFLAFNVTTGQLMTNVTHSFNAQVRSVFASPDKTKLYVAGEFTTVNGQTRRRIAEFTVNGNTGALTTDRLRTVCQLRRRRGGGHQQQGVRRWVVPRCRQRRPAVLGRIQRRHRCPARHGRRRPPAAQ